MPNIVALREAAPALADVPNDVAIDCPSCGTSNDAGVHFCEECGAHLTPRCPQCQAQWLVVGARENDRYVCKDCGHGFPIKLSSGEEELCGIKVQS